MIANELVAILKNAIVKTHTERPSKGFSGMFNLPAAEVVEIQAFRNQNNARRKIQEWTIAGTGFMYWLNEPPQTNVISQIPTTDLVTEKTSPQMMFVYSATAQVLYIEIWTD